MAGERSCCRLCLKSGVSRCDGHDGQVTTSCFTTAAMVPKSVMQAVMKLMEKPCTQSDCWSWCGFMSLASEDETIVPCDFNRAGMITDDELRIVLRGTFFYRDKKFVTLQL